MKLFRKKRNFSFVVQFFYYGKIKNNWCSNNTIIIYIKMENKKKIATNNKSDM